MQGEVVRTEAASFALPLALPLCAAAERLVAKRHAGPLLDRLAVATLTLGAPLILLLELRRLRAPPAAALSTWAYLADYWPEWVGLCVRAKACG